MEIKTFIYKTDSGTEPFTDWRKGYELQTQAILLIFIILWGGEKKSQKRDIEKAYRYLLDHPGTKL